MFCTQRCKQLAWLKRKPAYQEAQRELEAKRAARLRNAALKRLVRAISDCARKRRQLLDAARRADILIRKSQPCRACGGPIAHRERGQGGWATYCGKKCQLSVWKTTEAAKSLKRASRSARKAKQRAVTVEAFDPISILERDGWRCQICGVKTPKRLRGTYDDRAPEIDHIVSLAAGGVHAPWNVQCACRACNLDKSDGPPAGQIGLFTSLIHARQTSTSHQEDEGDRPP